MKNKIIPLVAVCALLFSCSKQKDNASMKNIMDNVGVELNQTYVIGVDTIVFNDNFTVSVKTIRQSYTIGVSAYTSAKNESRISLDNAIKYSTFGGDFIGKLRMPDCRIIKLTSRILVVERSFGKELIKL